MTGNDDLLLASEWNARLGNVSLLAVPREGSCGREGNGVPVWDATVLPVSAAGFDPDDGRGGSVAEDGDCPAILGPPGISGRDLPVMGAAGIRGASGLADRPGKAGSSGRVIERGLFCFATFEPGKSGILPDRSLALGRGGSWPGGGVWIPLNAVGRGGIPGFIPGIDAIGAVSV